MSTSLTEFADYSQCLQAALSEADWAGVGGLAEKLLECWKNNRQVFLCGNGGSAGNAIHLANDLLYGISKEKGHGIRATALPANNAVLTCLANDQCYDDVFAHQLSVLGQSKDMLIVLSGSGNSPNIIKVLEQACEMGMHSFAILGYSGGRAKGLADNVIHFNVHNMQIAEDMQLIVGHMVMQWLYNKRKFARS